MEIDVSFFSSSYLDVSVQRVGPPCGVSGLLPDGLSHSEISGSNLVCKSPELFAAYHVFLRLQEPRHPPYALIYFLTTSCNPIALHELSHLLNHVNERRKLVSSATRDIEGMILHALSDVA